MNPNETRSSHPSSAQVETLVEFLERNPGLAKGFLRTQNARERARRQWEELAVRLNSLGGTIKNYKQWTKETNDDQVQESQNESIDSIVSQQHGVPAGSEHMASNQHNRPDDSIVARRLFDSSSSSAVGTSQNILQDYQLVETAAEPYAQSYHASMSPPPITLSQTPSPLLMPIPSTPSPSRRGSTQVIHRRNAASSSTRHASQRNSTPIASSSRRAIGHMARASRGSDSVSSRNTAPPPANAPPPSQRRTEFSTFTERFLRVEEQQVEIQRTFAQILQTCVERNAERDRILAEAVTAVGKGSETLTAVGKGLEAVAEAIKRH